MSSLPMIGAHERVDGAGEVYRRLSDGKTFRLRTTNNPVLIAKVVDGLMLTLVCRSRLKISPVCAFSPNPATLKAT